ncbi:MAG: PadR family transcriptional regulator [Gemmatimonadota bacterium]
MGREGLGELEHQAMLALLHLEQDTYTAPIVEELERRTGRHTTVAAVYVVLRRLEEKGLVRSEMRGPGEEGGRDRRFFQVTPEGMERLRQAQEAYQALWSGLQLAPEEGR